MILLLYNHKLVGSHRVQNHVLFLALFELTNDNTNASITLKTPVL